MRRRPSMSAMASRAAESRTGRPWGNHACVDQPQEPPTGKNPERAALVFQTTTESCGSSSTGGAAVREGTAERVRVPRSVRSAAQPARGTRWKRGSLSQGSRRAARTTQQRHPCGAVRSPATSGPTPSCAQDQPWDKPPATTEAGPCGNNNDNGRDDVPVRCAQAPGWGSGP